jgi:hypothetical protein
MGSFSSLIFYDFCFGFVKHSSKGKKKKICDILSDIVSFSLIIGRIYMKFRQLWSNFEALEESKTKRFSENNESGSTLFFAVPEK